MALPVKISRSQPTSAFDVMQQEFDNALGRWFGGGRDFFGDGGSLAPYGVDIRDDKDHLIIEAELPGFKKDEIDISLENGTLSIQAEHREEKQQGEKQDYLLRERRYQRFMRSFTLPTSVDDKKVDAKYQDGLLTITLNKQEAVKPRKIPLQ
ncbi:MAG: Hsp20/alpha crystallin family protein [Tepidisphaeraceae bacterium]